MSLKSKIMAGVVAFGLSTGGAFAAVIDLGFSLDASGSVGSGNFNTVRTALAAALDSIPTAGANQYRIAVNKFASGVSTVVAPTIVTAANIDAIKTAVSTTSYTGGGTNTALAISNLTSLFVNAGGLSSATLLNITTDGQSNSQFATETESLNAFNAGVDGLSYEAIGNLGAATFENMRRSAALGTNGNTLAASAIITNNAANLPNPLNTGFVLTVTDFAGYSAAINAKVQRIVNPDPDPNVVPLPAGMPLLLAGMGVFAFMRRRKAAA